jgi:hypothetical protein
MIKASLIETAVSADLDPSLGHQKSSIAHLGDRHHVLRLREADTRRHARSATPWGEVKMSDLDERVSRRGAISEGQGNLTRTARWVEFTNAVCDRITTRRTARAAFAQGFGRSGAARVANEQDPVLDDVLS